MHPHATMICSAIIFFFTEITLSQLVSVDPDSLRNVSELISSKGYPVEDHNVITKDGYVLAIQRIPRGRGENGNELSSSKTPVLFHHGFLGAASDYVINFPHQSLGFILADAGYDVWLGNFRGNTYSSHINLSRDAREFWDFSADEMASEDLPSTIDTVLKITGKERLQYIGWSQGALIMFALLSEKPEYNKKISLFSAMAPAVYLGHFHAPFVLLVPFAELIRNSATTGVNGPLLTTNPTRTKAANGVCGSNIGDEICTALYAYLIGLDSNQLNKYTTGRAGKQTRGLEPQWSGLIYLLSNNYGRSVYFLLRDSSPEPFKILSENSATTGVNGPLLTTNPTRTKAANGVCGSNIGDEICTALYAYLIGLDSNQLNKYTTGHAGKQTRGLEPQWSGLIYLLSNNYGRSVYFLLRDSSPEPFKILSESRLAVYFSHAPAGASINNALHLAQLVRCNCLEKFDYGITKNIAKYGKPKPPGYTLSRAEVPVAIYWSKGDWFAAEQDVAHLQKELTNVVEYYQVPEEKFTHFDFGWGINAEPILYRKMMSVMEDFRT